MLLLVFLVVVLLLVLLAQGACAITPLPTRRSRNEGAGKSETKGEWRILEQMNRFSFSPSISFSLSEIGGALKTLEPVRNHYKKKVRKICFCNVSIVAMQFHELLRIAMLPSLQRCELQHCELQHCGLQRCVRHHCNVVSYSPASTIFA